MTDYRDLVVIGRTSAEQKCSERLARQTAVLMEARRSHGNCSPEAIAAVNAWNEEWRKWR